MRHVTLVVRLLLFAICIYLFLALMGRNDPMRPNAPMPFFLVVISWIDLFIHEAGHLIFSLFGRFVNILGGSLMQLLLPLFSVVVLFRSAIHFAPFAIYWLGENLVNVSIYARDATRMKLRLISRAATHDWNYLLGQLNMLDSTDSIANGLFYIGLLVCAAAIVFGIIQSILLYREEAWEQSPTFKSEL